MKKVLLFITVSLASIFSFAKTEAQKRELASMDMYDQIDPSNLKFKAECSVAQKTNSGLGVEVVANKAVEIAYPQPGAIAAQSDSRRVDLVYKKGTNEEAKVSLVVSLNQNTDGSFYALVENVLETAMYTIPMQGEDYMVSRKNLREGSNYIYKSAVVLNAKKAGLAQGRFTCGVIAYYNK